MKVHRNGRCQISESYTFLWFIPERSACSGVSALKMAIPSSIIHLTNFLSWLQFGSDVLTDTERPRSPPTPQPG